jgi:hypothetical protein
MRTSTAYFAGVGTVVFAVGAGLGGGYMAANIAHPPVQTVSKLERRMSAEPIPVSTAPAGQVPYAASPAQANSKAAPAQEPQQAQQIQPSQTQSAPQAQAAAPAANALPVEEKTGSNVAVAQPAPPPSKPAAEEKAATPPESNARANDADIRRAAADKRRAERRQRWADKQKWKQPREQPPREQEIDAVEARVREVTEPRRIRIGEEGEPRGFFGETRRRDMLAEPARSGAPRFSLFDQDD